jgi:hypothetical protein
VSDADDPSPLTDFQLEVAAVFFQLPASQGFLLAGGAALAAQHLTTRPTQDLDFFTSPGQGEVPAARERVHRGRAGLWLDTADPQGRTNLQPPTDHRHRRTAGRHRVGRNTMTPTSR